MRIENAGHGESVVTDLRVDPDALLKARETPFPPSEAAPPVVISGFATERFFCLGTSVQADLCGRNPWCLLTHYMVRVEGLEPPMGKPTRS